MVVVMAVTISASQLRAIGYYCEVHGVRPTLSTPPTFYFVRKDGTEFKKSIGQIVTEYSNREKKKK